MPAILPRVRFSVKQRLLQHLRRGRDAGLRGRYLIVLNLLRGRGASATADVLGVHNTTVYRVARRFRAHGEWGLLDGREDNGTPKLDERYLATRSTTVRSSPQQHGWRRPTGTRELLGETRARPTGVRIQVATRSRARALIRARRGRPRPPVRCPWSPAAQARRRGALRHRLAPRPRRHGAVYADEGDLHLNPTSGRDWMVRGPQKEGVTPGTNAKRYLAGAWEVRSGLRTWGEGERKARALFIALLGQLRAAYPQATRMQVLLDNYRIPDRTITQAAWQGWGGRMRRHFLPPYGPQANRIERVWEELHANVTRNHTCRPMDAVMREVREYRWRRNRIRAGMERRRAG